jgi:hypothetical protein
VTDLNARVNRHIQKELQAKLEKLTEETTKVSRALEEKIDIENGFFTASIYDIYDGLGPPCGSNTQTKRGLANALKAVEAEYEKRLGSIRTDGALSYDVYAELVSGAITLPPRLWIEFTSQTLSSLRK